MVFKIEDGFIKCDLSGTNFHKKMIDEADRATGALSAPWATLRDYGLYPFDEAALLQYTELAAYAETPWDVSRKLASLGTSARHMVRELLQDDHAKRPDSFLHNWITELKGLAPRPDGTSFQRLEFRKFAWALRHYRRGVRLPRFRVGEVSSWRSFVAMYPHSLRMLDHIVGYSKRENDLMFASALLPMLALSNNSQVSDEAYVIINNLRSRRFDFGSYAFQREMYRGAAEAGNKDGLGAGIDFITRNGSVPFERAFLHGYGWQEAVLSSNLNRKLNHPARRDQYLEKWNEAMADKLLAKG